MITGSPGTDYSLVVTRGADFVAQHNNGFDSAQPLDGVNVVLGAITKGGGALQALDDNSGVVSPIYQTDPVTGAFGSSIPTPIPAGFYLFGQNMANDGTYTYYNDGYGGSGTIYKLDSTGAVVASGTTADGLVYTALAYLNGELYAASPLLSSIEIIDPSTLAFVGTIPDQITDSSIVGLAGDPSRGVLWAVGQTRSPDGLLYEIDPATGNILKEGSDNAQGLYQQDLAYANGDAHRLRDQYLRWGRQ